MGIWEKGQATDSKSIQPDAKHSISYRKEPTMGDYQNINLAVEGRTAILTIDHPPANAFDTQTVTDLKEPPSRNPPPTTKSK